MDEPPVSASGGEAFPWDEAMAFGFGVLRLSSDAFWALTPRELAAAIDGAHGRARGDLPTSRATLSRLMAVFPDGGNE